MKRLFGENTKCKCDSVRKEEFANSNALFDLFCFFADEHDLILTDGQLTDIIDKVEENING